jgi:DNA-binding NtrC family response regulator
MLHILITDDDESFRRHLAHLFKRRGYHISEANSGEQALEIIRRQRFEVVLLDIVLTDIDGVEILRKLKNLYPETQVIMMTGNATVENAIASMKLGAYDYLIKPFNIDELFILVERAGELNALRREKEILQRERDWQRKFSDFVAESTHSKNVLQLIEKVAPTDLTVLITGDTGTGKEVVARTIHWRSERRNKPFVVINCSTIQDHLLESEMFGYAKGAFTGATQDKRGLIEVANTGTLFLDEIGDVSPDFQTKLLRFLESGEYRPVGSTHHTHSDVRIIAATNRALKKLMEERKFREDLFFRLNVFNIHLLPLKERMEDLPKLVDYCLKKICFRTGKYVPGISEEALKILQNYSWPGNIRELNNVIERAVILCPGGNITADDLTADIKFGVPSPASKSNRQSLAEMEREHILQILQTTEGNKTRAAEILGISKKTLYHKLREYELME